MLRIAICDDNVVLCSELENIIRKILKQYMINLDIVIFYTGEKFFEVAKREYFDIVFLDIELNTVNGIDVANQIRHELGNNTIQIIYISAKQKYAMQLFRTRPIDFLVKPFSYDEVKRVLQECVNLINFENTIFEYQAGKIIHRIPYREILYFESDNRIINIITFKEVFTFYGTLEGVKKNINQFDFISIHKSFLINYQHIMQIKYEQITMMNGKVLPISQSRRKEVRAFFLELEKKRGV